MPGQPLDRYRFVDGFLNQSPRLLASIRDKGYAFFPELEGQALAIKERWVAGREALRSQLRDPVPVDVLEEIHRFEKDVAPLGRMLDRLRKLYGGISSGLFEIAEGELPFWYEETAVVARGQKIPVDLYLTSERLILIRQGGKSGKSVRDYKLAEFGGLAPLSSGEGAVFLFGQEKIAIGTGSSDSWRGLLAKARPSIASGGAPVRESTPPPPPPPPPPARPAAPPPPPVLADGARTTILSPEVIASALAGLEERVPSRRPRTGAIPAAPSVGTIEETGKMSRPPAEPPPAPIAEPEDDDELEAVDLGALASEAMDDEPSPESTPSPDDEVAAMQARAASFFGDDGMLSGTPEDDPMPAESSFGIMDDDGDNRRSSVSSDELMSLDVEDEPPPALPAPPPPPPPPPPMASERGPGGHEVLPFDRIFQSAGIQADDEPPARPSEPASAEAASMAIPPVSVEPSATNPALRRLVSKDELRQRMRTESARYTMKVETVAAAGGAPGAKPPPVRTHAAATGKPVLLIVGIAIVLLVILGLAFLFGGGSDDEAPLDIGAIEQTRAAPTPSPTPEATPTPGESEAPPTTVVEERLAQTPIGLRPVQAIDPLPSPSKDRPSGIPSGESKGGAYRIELQDGSSWTVPTFVPLADRLLVPADGGAVEVTYSEIKSVTRASK